MVKNGTITFDNRILYQRMKGGFEMAFGAGGVGGACGGGIGAGIAAVVVIILLLIAMGIVF